MPQEQPINISIFVSLIIWQVNEILERVMSSIVHYSVFDIYTLLDLLHQLLHDLKSQVINMQHRYIFLHILIFLIMIF